MREPNQKWTFKAKSLIKELHLELSLNNRNWHRLKNNSDRRASELLIAAISQISEQGKKEDVIPLIEQALKWVKNELKDPGCSIH